jgi:hypothetical protein
MPGLRATLRLSTKRRNPLAKSANFLKQPGHISAFDSAENSCISKNT